MYRWIIKRPLCDYILRLALSKWWEAAAVALCFNYMGENVMEATIIILRTQQRPLLPTQLSVVRSVQFHRDHPRPSAMSSNTTPLDCIYIESDAKKYTRLCICVFHYYVGPCAIYVRLLSNLQM